MTNKAVTTLAALSIPLALASLDACSAIDTARRPTRPTDEIEPCPAAVQRDHRVPTLRLTYPAHRRASVPVGRQLDLVIPGDTDGLVRVPGHSGLLCSVGEVRSAGHHLEMVVEVLTGGRATLYADERANGGAEAKVYAAEVIGSWRHRPR